MSADQNRVSLKMNVLDGTIEIESSAENFSQVAEKAKEIVLAARTGGSPALAATASVRTAAPTPASPVATAPTADSRAADKKTKATRSPGGSSGRPGRIGSFEPIKFNLAEASERSLRDFLREKAPIEQSHQVAAAMFKGEEILGKQSFEYNEIYTLLHLGGIKPLPKALDVVLGKLTAENWVTRDGKAFSLKFVGRDFVTESLPLAKAA